jgi:O-antigen/teichoic acid export membrane protein
MEGVSPLEREVALPFLGERNSMNTGLKILVNMLSGWLSILLQAIIGIILIPFLIHILGENGYGLIGLLGVIAGLSLLTDMGLRTAITRQLSEARAKNDTLAFNQLSSTALSIYLLLAGAICLVLLLFAPAICVLFNVKGELLSAAIPLVRYYGCAVVLTAFVTPILSATYMAHNRYDILNTVQILVNITSGLALFAVLGWGNFGLIGWAWTMAATHVIRTAVLYITARRLWSFWRFSPSFINFKMMKPTFKLGGSVYILQLSKAISEYADPLILTTYFGPMGVALYVPGRQLSSLVQPFVLTLSDQLHPVSTQQFVKNNKDNLQKLLVKGTRHTFLFGILSSVGIFFFAESFCKLWLGSELGEKYLTVAMIMKGWAIIDLLTFSGGTQWPVLLGMKRLKVLILTNLPSAIINLALSIYFVGFTSWGIIGVILATVVISILRRPYITYYTAKVCGLTFSEYFNKAYYRPLIVLGIFSLFCNYITLTYSFDTYQNFATGAAVSVFIWAILWWTIGIDQTDKSMVYTIFQKVRTKLSSR